jgi:hypothetical protein
MTRPPRSTRDWERMTAEAEHKKWLARREAEMSVKAEIEIVVNKILIDELARTKAALARYNADMELDDGIDTELEPEPTADEMLDVLAAGHGTLYSVKIVRRELARLRAELDRRIALEEKTR